VTAGTAWIVGKQIAQPKAPNGANKGTSALHPGFAEFDPPTERTAGSGHLEAEGSEGSVLGVTEGSVKILGLEHQEHIWAENHP
jgi:hypothetical protein